MARIVTLIEADEPFNGRTLRRYYELDGTLVLTIDPELRLALRNYGFQCLRICTNDSLLKGYVCSLGKGHVGPHAAVNADVLIGTWSQSL